MQKKKRLEERLAACGDGVNNAYPAVCWIDTLCYFYALSDMRGDFYYSTVYNCMASDEAYGNVSDSFAAEILSCEYYPPWEPPVSRFRATRKWYFPPSEPPQHIVAAHIFDFTINLLIVILGELLMQYHQIIYKEVFLCLRRQKSEVSWNFWEKI